MIGFDAIEEWDVRSEWDSFDYRNCPQFDFTTEIEEEIDPLKGSFDFGLREYGTASWYQTMYPKFPAFFYPILQENTTGIPCDRQKMRECVMRDRKMAKKMRMKIASQLKKFNLSKDRLCINSPDPHDLSISTPQMTKPF